MNELNRRLVWTWIVIGALGIAGVRVGLALHREILRVEKEALERTIESQAHEAAQLRWCTGEMERGRDRDMRIRMVEERADILDERLRQMEARPAIWSGSIVTTPCSVPIDLTPTVECSGNVTFRDDAASSVTVFPENLRIPSQLTGPRSVQDPDPSELCR